MATQRTMPLVDTKVGGSRNPTGSVPFPVAVGDRRSNFSTAVKATLGRSATLAPATSVNLDLRKGPVHSTTGIPYAIGGTATVVSQKVGLWLAEFEDPIKAILGVGVHKDEKIIIKRKYAVGGGATIVPERAPARTVAIQEDVREVTLTRYGGDIEMNLNLFLTGEAEEEMDMKIDCQKRELERQLIKIGYDTLITEGTLLTDAIMRSSPAYQQGSPVVANKLASQAFQIYSTKIFGAINKFRFPIANLLAAAKYASAYSLCSQKGSVMIVPHGVPELTTIARKEKMQYNISGLQNDSKITMDMDGAFTDPNSGVRILVHHSTPSYDQGAANPTVNLANANLSDTCHVITIHKAKHGATNGLSTTTPDFKSPAGLKLLNDQLCLMAAHHFKARQGDTSSCVLDHLNGFRLTPYVASAKWTDVLGVAAGDISRTAFGSDGTPLDELPYLHENTHLKELVPKLIAQLANHTYRPDGDACAKHHVAIIVHGLGQLYESFQVQSDVDKSTESLLRGVLTLNQYFKDAASSAVAANIAAFTGTTNARTQALFTTDELALFVQMVCTELTLNGVTLASLKAWATSLKASINLTFARLKPASVNIANFKDEINIAVGLGLELLALLVKDTSPDEGRTAETALRTNFDDAQLETYARASLHVDEINVRSFDIDNCTQGPGQPLAGGSSAAASENIRKYFASLYGDRHTISIADIENGGIRHDDGAVTVRIAKVIASSAILAAPGDSTGQLLIGYPFTGVSTSATEERMRVQLRCYLGAALYQPDAVMILPNVFVDGIDSCEYYTFSSIGWATQLEEAIYHMQMGSGGFDTPTKIDALKSKCKADETDAGDKGKFAKALLAIVTLWEHNQLNVYPTTSGKNRVRLPAGSLYDGNGNKICDNEGEFGDLDDKKNYIGLHGVPQTYERGNF